MANEKEPNRMLSGYRALDLTDERGFLCGKILGDLGVDVIKIEKPGGDPSRNIAPFFHDTPDPEKSLYWFAFNASKRGITLNIETDDGREIFKKLTTTADFIIESSPPGYMDKIGLGYEDISQVHPEAVFTSITPFGQTGPYRDFKTSDIVSMAESGGLYVTGDPDRPPVRVGFPQAYSFAGVEAAAGTLMALHYRHMTSKGQHVDISIQRSLTTVSYDVPGWWTSSHVMIRRQGATWKRPKAGAARVIHPCKDGFVSFVHFGGIRHAKKNEALVQWMDEEGMATDFLKQMDWVSLSWTEMTPDDLKNLEEPTRKFFMTHTKKELLEGSLKREILLYPVSTPKDLLENEQLESRGYWTALFHPELDTSIVYPGPWVKASETDNRTQRRAPLIGEHNQEVYVGELGFSQSDLVILKQIDVI